MNVTLLEQTEYDLKNNTQRVMLSNIRTAFPRFWAPKLYKGKIPDPTKVKCEGQFIIPNDQANKAAIAELMKAYLKIEGTAYDKVEFPKIKMAPDDHKYFPGNLVLRTTNTVKVPPKYVTLDGATQVEASVPEDATPEKPLVEPIEPSNGQPVSSIIKSGDYVNIIVSFARKSAGDSEFTYANLVAAQFAKKGEMIGSDGASETLGMFGAVEAPIPEGFSAGDGFDTEIPPGNPAAPEPEVDDGLSWLNGA